MRSALTARLGVGAGALLIEATEILVRPGRTRRERDRPLKMRLGAGERALLGVDHPGEVVQRRAGRIARNPSSAAAFAAGEILRVEELGDALDRLLQRRLGGRAPRRSPR